MDEFGANKKTPGLFVQITDMQNKIRKTNYSFGQAVEGAIEALLKSTLPEDRLAVTKGSLQSFSQYLLEGNIRKPDYWQMAYRLSAYINCFRSLENAEYEISELEKNAGNYKSREYVNKCEEELTKNGIREGHAHELKILAPKALVYLHETFRKTGKA